jgi:hypothetical protein
MNTARFAQAGVAGSTVIGDRVVVGGKAGVADNLPVRCERRQYRFYQTCLPDGHDGLSGHKMQTILSMVIKRCAVAVHTARYGGKRSMFPNRTRHTTCSSLDLIVS